MRSFLAISELWKLCASGYMIPGTVWDLALTGLSCLVLYLQGNLGTSLPSPLQRGSKGVPLEAAPKSQCLKSDKEKGKGGRNYPLLQLSEVVLL